MPGLGRYKVKKLIHAIDDLERVFKLSKTELRAIEGIGEASALKILSFDDWKEVDNILQRSEEINAQIVTLVDAGYPALLKQIYDPPILLWVRGETEVLNEPGLAVIGTRNMTGHGRKIGTQLTTELAEQGLVINSGLAYGVDVIAHKAAMQAGGKTVAVLGSAIDKLYPKSHAEIANQIVKTGGAIITEYAPGTEAEPGFFPERNRIVSGLSYGTLVIESSIQGGSMITAELALDQNREVFAVPHSLENLNGTGCNYLIKTGTAKLVQSAQDIMDELPIEREDEHPTFNIQPKKRDNWKKLELDDLSKKICLILEDREYQIDEIADSLQFNTSRLLVALLQLEMKGIVIQKAGKIFDLK